jgi:hypothetical protein
MIDLPTDGSLPDGAFNDDHLGTLDAVRGAVHPISKGLYLIRSHSHRGSTAICAKLPYEVELPSGARVDARQSLEMLPRLNLRQKQPSTDCSLRGLLRAFPL